MQVRTDVVRSNDSPKFLKDVRLGVPSPEADVLRVGGGVGGWPARAGGLSVGGLVGVEDVGGLAAWWTMGWRHATQRGPVRRAWAPRPTASHGCRGLLGGAATATEVARPGCMHTRASHVSPLLTPLPHLLHLPLPRSPGCG